MFFDAHFSGRAEENDKGRKSIKENEFIEEFGKLDLFLAECLNQEKSSQSEHPPMDTLTQASSQQGRNILIKKLLDFHRSPINEEASNQESSTSGSVQKLEPGTILGERYEVKSYVAKGGFGEVYKGHHKQLDIDVAIKVLRKKKVGDSKIRKRFFREAKIMATINHPNVVRIYDVGEFNGSIYLIMDFIEGNDLDNLIRHRDLQPSSKDLNLMIQIADALAAIHNQGIIHRDIKPGNIMVDLYGKPILMDFGLAKEGHPSVQNQGNLTVEGMCLGTPLYMAPEQFTTPEGATKSSDIYSLGVTFYQLITGTNPFSGKTHQEVYLNHKTISPSPVDSFSKEISPQISRIITKMLDKDPLQRYADGAALRDALRQVERKKVPNFIILGGIVAMIGIAVPLAVQQGAFKQLIGWVTERQPDRGDVSSPRTYSVIPFGASEQSNTYFSDIITNFLSEADYDIVERERIEEIIKELNLSKSKWSDKDTAVRIGKEIGAHIIITGNISSYKGQDQINVRAFNVETSEILGAVKIDPKAPESTIETLIRKVNTRLVYRSNISALAQDQVELKQGKFHGAAIGMKLRVLDKNKQPIGVLEITEVERDRATAKVLTAESGLKIGMNVEEVK